jgi:cytochrome c biogenesis protein CcmG, thiol:disulfide interchange protein DsbE
MNYFRYVLPFIIFLSIVMLLWRGLSLHPNQIPSPLLNKPTPHYSLPNLLDTKHPTTQKDFLGKVTLVNVWASWCPACAEEHDYLVQLAQEQHIRFYGINYKDNPVDALKILKSAGNPYRIVAVDQSGNAAIDWGVYGAPETFIVDKNGIIRYKHIGPITPEIWENKLKSLVNQLESEN